METRKQKQLAVDWTDTEFFLLKYLFILDNDMSTKQFKFDTNCYIATGPLDEVVTVFITFSTKTNELFFVPFKRFTKNSIFWQTINNCCYFPFWLTAYSLPAKISGSGTHRLTYVHTHEQTHIQMHSFLVKGYGLEECSHYFFVQHYQYMPQLWKVHNVCMHVCVCAYLCMVVHLHLWG